MEFDVSFKGEKAAKYRLIVARRPDIPAPEENVEEIQVPGRSGALIERPGTYKPITIPIAFNFMADPDRWAETFRKAKEWLSGSGELWFSDDDGIFYKAYYCRITSTERTSKRIGNFMAEFVCDPYCYVKRGKREYEKEEVEYNPYSVCCPTFLITGNGDCTLTVNGKRMEAAVGQNLTINTELMLAYRTDGTVQNTAVSGEYENLYLRPGDNSISITAGFGLRVIPNWRSL